MSTAQIRGVLHEDLLERARPESGARPVRACGPPLSCEVIGVESQAEYVRLDAAMHTAARYVTQATLNFSDRETGANGIAQIVVGPRPKRPDLAVDRDR
jgi:hypothetical protein